MEGDGQTKNVTCELCGGTEFYKESGYYYCTECQTQTLEMREQVFDTEIEAVAPKQTKKIKPKHKAKSEQITSWECYNYILLGLVNELIELGADSRLKQVVRFLWFRYLEKLEVINNMGKPKLQAFNSAVDAEIIYGRSAKRKRVRKSPSLSPSSESDVSSMKREQAKKKKAMMVADYEENTLLSTTMDSSLLNQSLLTLKGSNDSSTNRDEKYLQYNRSAKDALLKVMKKNHLKKHRKDIHAELKCHKVSTRKLPQRYVEGPSVLTRSKLFGLLYIGLLLNKDKLQLGDLLRFIREGHLSYNQVEHFIPEDKADKKLNMKTYTNCKAVLTHRRLRLTTAKLAVYLNVQKYIPLQNLPALCQRYCKELNLPDEVATCTLIHMSLVKPQMKVTSKTSIIPNYEARAMNFIIFTLKLLTGLDDETEYQLSNISHQLNGLEGNKMFVLDIWMKHLIYRKVILQQHHFPTQFLTDKLIEHPRTYLNFMQDQTEKIGQKDLNVEFDIVRQLLEKLLLMQNDESKDLKFEASLTPFRDYVDVILKSDLPVKDNYNQELLAIDFQGASLNLLFYPSHYLNLLTKKPQEVKLFHGGANSNLITVKCSSAEMESQNKNKNYLLFKVGKEDVNLVSHTDGKEHEAEQIASKFDKVHKCSYENNTTRMNKLLKEKFPNEDVSDVFCNNGEYRLKYFIPEERYWLLTESQPRDLEAILKKLPLSFQLILSECARIIEQTERNLLEEFTYFELYMCYVADYKKRKVRKKKIQWNIPDMDEYTKKLIIKAKRVW